MFNSIIKPQQAGIKKFLGNLEAEIMEVVWGLRREVTVRDVYKELLTKREIAYTTVMTEMKILTEKGLLKCSGARRESRAYQYFPTMSRSKFIRRILRHTLKGLLSEFSEPTMANLVDLAGEDPKLAASVENRLRDLIAEDQATSPGDIDKE